MRIVGMYYFNDPDKTIATQYAAELEEIESVISSIDARKLKSKVSKEKTKTGRVLFSPPALNKAFKKAFFSLGWVNRRVPSIYPTTYYVNDYQPSRIRASYRDMDFVKNKLGVEVQFGKYSFMVYNVAAKMTIFRNLGIIDAGIEIVPVKELVRSMSSGVSYFEQFLWDLENRGISNIDTPVLILGIAP